jgi:hypothetical protein
MRTACLGIIVGVCLVTGAPAAGQTVTVPDVEGTVTDVVDTVSSTVDDTDVVGTVSSTADDVVGTAEDTVTQVSGSATSSGDSSGSITGGVFSTASGISSDGSSDGSGSTTTSSQGGSTASSSPRAGGGSRPQIRSRFDRLPRRLETLLERIELGQHVRANLRRLERALASASPELRSRVLRQIRAEIARLRDGGVTKAERRRINRLQFVLEELTTGTGAAGPAGKEAVSPSTLAAASFIPSFAADFAAPGAGRGPDEGTGVLSARAGGSVEEPGSRGISFPPVPDRPGEFPFGIGLILLGLLILGLVGVVASVTNHIGRARSG